MRFCTKEDFEKTKDQETPDDEDRQTNKRTTNQTIRVPVKCRCAERTTVIQQRQANRLREVLKETRNKKCPEIDDDDYVHTERENEIKRNDREESGKCNERKL